MSSLAAQFAALNTKLTKMVEQVAVDTAQHIADGLREPELEPNALNPNASPVWTGSYILSHRIGVNEQDTSFTDRRERITDKAEIQGLLNSSPLNADDITKKEKFTLGESIIVSNRVRHTDTAGGFTTDPYATKLENGPSPWKKTPGEIYYNSAVTAAQDMQGGGITIAVSKIAKSSKKASPVKIGVVV